MLIVYFSLLLIRLLSLPFFGDENRVVFKRKVDQQTHVSAYRHFPRKPDWVIEEVIRLKAHMPQASGYLIADTFNRLHRTKNQMTVGKSFVYGIFKKQQQAILLKRKTIKTRKPTRYDNNQR